MTLTDIIMYMAIAGGLWTAMVHFLWQKSKNILITFLQSFCGALFIFSGWVKAIDPWERLTKWNNILQSLK